MSSTSQFTEPNSPPQEYVATNISSRTIQFSWHSPAVTEWNGVITNYTLACDSKVDGVDSITMTYEDAGSHTLGGFRPATKYNCSVFASNTAGNSPKATIITITTKDESKQITHSLIVRKSLLSLLDNMYAGTFFQIWLIGLDSCPQWVVSIICMHTLIPKLY